MVTLNTDALYIYNDKIIFFFHMMADYTMHFMYIHTYYPQTAVYDLSTSTKVVLCHVYFLCPKSHQLLCEYQFITGLGFLLNFELMDASVYALFTSSSMCLRPCKPGNLIILPALACAAG